MWLVVGPLATRRRYTSAVAARRARDRMDVSYGAAAHYCALVAQGAADWGHS